VPFNIVKDDITTMHVDAIVNAANTNLIDDWEYGVCDAIFRAAGKEQMQEACSKLAPVMQGHAVATPGFNLPVKCVIHAVGPIYEGWNKDECKETLRSACMEALRLAVGHECKSVAFPLMASGAMGYPREDAKEVAISAFKDFLGTHEMDIYLCVPDKKDMPQYRGQRDIDRFIERHYHSDSSRKTSYRMPSLNRDGSSYGYSCYIPNTLSNRRKLQEERDEIQNAEKELLMCEELDYDEVLDFDIDEDLIDAETLKKSPETHIDEGQAIEEPTQESKDTEESAEHRIRMGAAKLEIRAKRAPSPSHAYSASYCCMTPKGLTQRQDSLEWAIRGLDESFSDSLLRIIREKGMSEVDVYKRANMDRKHFAKIRAGKNGYTPKKPTILALAISLELTVPETKALLEKAGYALSHSFMFDVIIEYFLENRNYDIFEINEVLFQYDQQLLG